MTSHPPDPMEQEDRRSSKKNEEERKIEEEEEHQKKVPYSSLLLFLIRRPLDTVRAIRQLGFFSIRNRRSPLKENVLRPPKKEKNEKDPNQFGN